MTRAWRSAAWRLSAAAAAVLGLWLAPAEVLGAPAAPTAAKKPAPKTTPTRPPTARARPRPAPAPSTPDGWPLVIAGRNAQAEEAFAARLARSPADLGSAVGLAALLEVRNDAGGAAAVLVRALRQASRGPLAAGAIAALTWLLPRAPDGGAEAIPLLTDIVDGRRGADDPEVRLIARQTLADALARTGAPDRGLEVLRTSTGGVVQWSIMGPYGRFERLDLLRPFPPENDEFPAAPGPDAEIHAPLRFDGAFPDGRVTTPVQFRDGGVIYAAADVVLDQPATLRLALASPTSFRLFVDGQLALTADRVREHPPIRLAAKVDWTAGRHRLLVKLANTGRREVFTLTIDSAGESRSAPFSAALPTGKATGKSQLAPWPSPLDDGVRTGVELTPAPALAAAWWLRVRGLDERTGPLLERAHAAWPDASLFTAALGEWSLNARTGKSTDEDLARARALLGQAVTADSRLARPRLLVGRMDENANELTQAWQAGEAVLAVAPDDPDALALEHRVAARRGWLVEADRRIERARAAAPGRDDLLDLALDFQRRYGPNRKLGETLQEKHRRDPLDDDWATYLGSLGRTADARAAWEQMRAIRPSDLRPYLGLARLLLDQGAPADALAVLDQARTLFPPEPLVHLQRAGVLAQEDKNDDAAAELRRTLALDPSRIELWDTLHRRGEPDPLAPWLGDAHEILSAARRPGPGTDSALLADIAAVLIDRDGGQTELYQGIHAVYTRAGVEREGELEVFPGAQVQGIRIHKSDGRYADVVVGDKRPVSLPGLEPGDAIEYVWRRFIPPFALIPGSLDNRSLFLFQGADREYVLSRYVVIHDRDLPVEVCGNSRDLEYKDEVQGSRRVRAWTARSMPRLSPEPHIADPLEVAPNVRLSLSASWQDVGELLKSAIAGMLHPDPPLPELADEVRRRAGTGDPEALARALHAVVRDRLRPGDSALVLGTPASAAASAGEGNRVGVALALAQMFHLDARLLLTRPIEQKGRQLDCPYPQTFSYALVELMLGDRRVYLDYTDVDHPYDAIPPRMNGADALEVPLSLEAPAQLVELPRRPPRVLEETAGDLTLGADGNVSGRFSLTVRGELGGVLRRMLREAPADMRPNAFRQMAEGTFPGAEVVDSRVVNEGDPDQDLTVELQIKGGRWARRTPTGFALPLVHHPLGLLSEFGSLPSRRFALLLDAQEFRRDVLRVALPPGLAASEAPAPVNTSGPFGSYSLRAALTPGAVEIVREATIPPARVEPTDYPAFRDFARAVDDAESRELLLNVSSPSLAH